MSNMYAKYTQTFHDFLKDNPTFLDDVITFEDNERKEKLKVALTSEFNLYEIGGETPEIFKIMFEDTFKQYKDYYNERITAYEKQYDYTTGNKRRTLKSSNIGTEGSNDSYNKSSNKHTNIELPNRQVSSDYEGYPNDINTDDGRNEDHRAYANETKLNDEVTTIFDDEFLDLKRKYMEQLRNIYLEFAKKFKECFILIY